MSDLRACCDVTITPALRSQIMKVSLRKLNVLSSSAEKYLLPVTKENEWLCDDVEQNCVSHKQKQMF